MTMPSGAFTTDDIARVAYAIWEAEGQPEGRDHEQWMRARQLLEEGRAEIEFPTLAAAPDNSEDRTPNPGPARFHASWTRKGVAKES